MNSAFFLFPPYDFCILGGDSIGVIEGVQCSVAVSYVTQME